MWLVISSQKYINTILKILLAMLTLKSIRIMNVIVSSFLYGALNIHLYALYKQTVGWGKHSSIVLKSNTQLATAPTVDDVTFHFWNIVSVWIDEF